MYHKQFSTIAGMIGAILFILVFTIEGIIRPGYNPVSMFVSELSLGSRGWIQISNFIITGMLLNIFTNGVSKEFKKIGSFSAGAGPVMLRIISISLLVSGPLIMDPANTPRDQMSWHGILHGIFGALVFSLAPISCFSFYQRFKSDPQWKILRAWTLTAGIIMTIAVIFLSYVTKTANVPSQLHNFSGLIQRMVLIPFFIWIFTFAFVLHGKNYKMLNFKN